MLELVGTDMSQIKYFISYAREDKEFVLKLATRLRGEGVEVWLDKLELVAGQQWDREIEEALEACRGMLVVMSPEAMASKNVRDEWSYALDEEKLVVPILLRRTTIPVRLRRLHYIDFSAEFESRFTHLLRALQVKQSSVRPEKRQVQQPPAQQPLELFERVEKEKKQYLAFISYAAQDKSWAKQLYKDLIETKGISEESIFLTALGIDPVDSWVKKRRALASSFYFIVLWSSNARNSEGVNNEVVAFQHSITLPDVELMQVRQRMIFIALDEDEAVFKDNQVITTLKIANVYDPKNPSIDRLLRHNRVLWNKVVERVYQTITRD
jgi:hypothetical protein